MKNSDDTTRADGWFDYPNTTPPKAGYYRVKFPSGHCYRLRFDGKWEWPDIWRSSTQPVAWSFLLKTLDEWNENRESEIRLNNTYPQLNGIACPECGAELQDTDAMVLLSYPAKRNVSCSKCDYRGYRVV